MHPLTKSVIAFACVFGAALVGMFLRSRMPAECQATESKEVVRLVMGLVVTTVALALGLLVGSAKSFYDTQNAEMAQMAANEVLLDQMLRQYGPEASHARLTLRRTLADMLGESEPKGASQPYSELRAGVLVGGSALDEIWALSPKDDNQKFAKQQCLNLAINLGQIRWLIFTQNTIPFPTLLLCMLISWLIVLFASFGLFAPRNSVVLVGLLASAAVVCGAILLILEMYHPQSMLIRVSEAPLRAAMAQLGR